MQTISLLDFKRYLTQEDLRLKLESENQQASINKNLVIEVVQDGESYKAVTKDLGFIVKFSSSANPVKCADYDAVEELLFENGFLKENQAQIVLINDNFSTFDEYLKAKKLENATMAEILGLTSSADRFSLSLRLTDFGISNLDASVAYQNLSAKVFSELQHIFNKIPKNKKTASFETVLAEIIDEVSKNMPFVCDLVAEGKTKYGQEYWHFYSLIEFIFNAKITLEKLKSQPISPLTDILKDYPLLFDNLVDAKVSFFNEVTLSSEPIIVFTFKLTEKTKSYLLSFENDYKISPFEDLAIYFGEKLLFSSCTHEGFHDFLI